ncbi:AMP-binding protein [Advenella sp. RU8]|uniref:AMP-binding protein n=1 Tax=Advenella sp. RU8 TaxID=3399575 RepID=UPI003AAF6A27
MKAEFLNIPFLPRHISIETRPDGTLIVRSEIALKAREKNIPSLLHRNAQQRPHHPWLAQRRGEAQQWVSISYQEGQKQVNAITQYLLNLNQPGKTVMVLSANSIEHGILEVAAMQARMPYAPITTAYSLLSRDFSKLKAMYELLEPAVIFVQDGKMYENALQAIGQDAHVICVDNPIKHPSIKSWHEVIQTPVTRDVADSIDKITGDTVTKYQFTSGSTGIPKAAIVTQSMLCTAMAMTSQMIEWGDDRPETILLDWLPWSHVAGGHAVFNGVLEDGGTLYIDNGRPTPTEFQQTLKNLKEISPVRFSGMPVSYTMLAEALQKDEALGKSFFRNLKRMTYSGAKLPETVYDAIQQQAIRHTGYKIPFVSAYGSTETSAAVTYVHWPSNKTGLIGLPHPGVEMKLVPLHDENRYEIRVRSAAVTPGYLKQPALTAESFDEEGFFKMGDAATFVDPANPHEGLAFAGRVAEEFKLQSGVFVRVSALRVDCLNACSPLLNDVVITGADRAYLGALVWLNLAECCRQFNLDPHNIKACLQNEKLRESLKKRFLEHNKNHPGSSMAIKRIWILETPPSIDSGETTDKGYINQRKVLENRKQEVEKLYEGDESPNLILI